MRQIVILVLAVLMALGFLIPSVAAESIAGTAFYATWARTDLPASQLRVRRTWMWGPMANTVALQEAYAESPGGQRLVQYFDKTRMEITHPDGDQSSIWYVTNGLLAKELITGNMQLGDNTFHQYAPAQVNVAGDADDPTGPTYSTFSGLMRYGAIPSGWKITQTVNRAGHVGDDPSLASYNASAMDVGAPTNHTVASVFWDFMTSSGAVYQNGQYVQAGLFQDAFYATGYPLTEAYWTNVLVGGVQKQVLVQVFERRVLTFTPSNPAGWQVEAGNVGQHYYQWRYGILGNTPSPLSPQPLAFDPGLPAAVYDGVSFSFDPTLAASVTSSIVPPAGDLAVGFRPQSLNMRLDSYPIWRALGGSASVTIYSTASLIGTGNQDSVNRLQQLLSQRPPLISAVALSSGPDPNETYPAPPATNAAQMIAGRPAYLDFQDGSGARWITMFAQNRWPAQPDQLWYIYEGLTADGQYAVSIEMPINAQLSLPPITPQNMDTASVVAYNQQVVDLLQPLSPAGFQPNLDALDALVKSLNVTPDAGLASALAVQH